MRLYIEDFLRMHDKYDIRKVDLLKINSIEILMNIINQAPTISVRSFILSEEQKREGYPFIKQLASHMLYSFEYGIKTQVFEFIKALLDNENTDKKVEFLDFFYKEVLSVFMAFLASVEDIPMDQVQLDDYHKAVEFNRSLECARALVIQILCKCVQEQSFRFRIFVVQSEVIEKVSSLAKLKSKVTNLWIVKFYKAIVKAKDDSFNMYLTKKKLLKTIVDIFLENPNKQNVLHSCVLELFDFLTTKDQNKKIASHLLETYSEVLFKAPKFVRLPEKRGPPFERALVHEKIALGADFELDLGGLGAPGG